MKPGLTELHFPGGFGQNDQLIGSIMAKDWQSRPNLLNSSGTGPGRDNFKSLTGALNMFMPNIKFERKQNLLCGDKVVVVSKVTGTVNNPANVEEVPLFPGIPAERVVGKSFETMAIDLHLIKNGRMKQAWHVEDWATALAQMVNGSPTPDLGFNPNFVPQV